MKHAGYREAIYWLANNDDNEWLKDDEPVMSVTSSLVCDLFGVDEARLIRDLRLGVKKVTERVDFLR